MIVFIQCVKMHDLCGLLFCQMVLTATFVIKTGLRKTHVVLSNVVFSRPLTHLMQ